MCGIAGVYGLPEREGAAAAERMGERLGHRGPDDVGTYVGPRLALSHRRLSILDLSPAGHQPMWTADGRLGVVFNGEIYNFREMANELQVADPAVRMNSRSDTEVLLKAYHRWGRGCLQRLRGMFAFAIWDEDRRELFLARDRLGIKPLYYYVAADGVVLFASEVRALLASGLVPRKLDAVALWQYLTYQCVPAPRTLIEDVRALPPGCWLAVRADGQITQGCYWDLLKNATMNGSDLSMGESRRQVAELLREAVSLHLVSDVPVGVFLSGGIDSSAVVALMREAGHVPHTFTVVFSEHDFDERRYAREVATRFGTDHTEILLRDGDLLEQLPDALAAMDQVSGDGVNAYLISRAAKAAGMKVALCGLGGDEFFGGYPSFARLQRTAGLLRHWGSLPTGLRALVAWAARFVGRSTITTDKLATLLESAGNLPEALLLLRQVWSLSQRRQLLAAPWLERVQDAPEPYLDGLREAFAGAPTAGLFARISYGEARTYMHDVLLRDMDQMSMAHSLEVRVPLLDHRLVEYVTGLPDSHKLANGIPKRLLVESLGGALPDAIVRRPKQGFTLPFEVWMRQPLRRFCEERLGPDRLGRRGIFSAERLQRYWQGFLAGQRDVSWSRLWVLVALEEWIERNGVSVAP